MVELKKRERIAKSLEITVQKDPVYHASKKYEATPLLAILKKYSALNTLNIKAYKVVFECEDGYKPEMNLEKLVNSRAFLAFKDIDAPAGRDFSEIKKGGQTMKAEPFYVVYEGVDPNDGSYKWPYNLIKIHFELINNAKNALMPKEQNALAGYDLYVKKCQTCHSLNGIGGQMGPELNYPKNITEYWHKRDLKAFIRNPAEYRAGVKMPTLEISEQDSEDLFIYLKYMTNHKNKPNG